MTRNLLTVLIATGMVVSALSIPAYTAENVGPPPVITTPAENAWFAVDAPVDYCWELPPGVPAGSVNGYLLQFSNSGTADGPWDQARFFRTTCWHYAAGHQGIWEALYWRVQILYINGDKSPWAVSYHRVGTFSTVGSPPVITSPAENALFAPNEPVDYCWELPAGVLPGDVSGYELQFSNTETPDGPWDAVRFFTATCWHYAAGHQGTYDALYWRVRIEYINGDRSPWAISYHQVKENIATDASSWGEIKNAFK